MITEKPVLIILVGAPGSGKTYVAEQFSRHNNFVHVNSDSVRADFIPEPTFTAEERERVYVKIHQVVSQRLLEGKNVIFDGNLLTNEARFEALSKYHDMGVRVLFAFLDIPSKIAITRALSRETSHDGLYNAMPEERAVRMHKTFEKPDPKLPQVVITDTDNYQAVEAALLNALKQEQG